MDDRKPLPQTPTLETARLILRPLEARDAGAIQRLFGQWEVVKHLYAGIPWPYPVDGAATNTAQSIESRAKDERFYWTITLKGSDELRGRIDLWAFDPERRDSRGFWLDPELWGQGLMTEAADAVTAYALETLRWPYLYLTNAAHNAASARVKEKQGATLAYVEPCDFMDGPGERQVWLLTREAWLARRGRPVLPPTPVLETGRLVLRPLAARDIPAIQRIFPQWELVKHLGPQVPWPYPEDGAARNMAMCLEQRAKGEKFFWAITLKGDDALRGRIDLWPFDGERKDMRGFWLDPELWGRGLMTEAAEAVTGYAFEALKWPFLYLSNAAANAGSHRVKEKQGAVEVGRAPFNYVCGPSDKVTWLLTREAWLSARGKPAD